MFTDDEAKGMGYVRTPETEELLKRVDGKYKDDLLGAYYNIPIEDWDRAEKGECAIMLMFNGGAWASVVTDK